ncbi:EVE domain-containing protein [Mycobacterium sp. MYCO198283]|uniref:EVE domain-containing protein n=1 Tax=Mycobacterium sp. MYCO198283 TaxID=2883505 RepID=UPI001E443BC2|nr:EVE domain-containing protein [Mycobacterium sp. MYCO198283]MCG5433302.1 EVE domain-containing protein [Mycobacterium sp. MYCO198283]
MRAVTPQTLGAWVIKCNPAVTDIAPMLAAGAAKPWWCVADNYRSRLLADGQRVLFWVSGCRRGIWGAGRVTGVAVPGDDGRLHVPTAIALFDEPVPAAALLTVPGLGALEVFRSPQQANPSWVDVAALELLRPLLPPGAWAQR